MDLKQMTEEMYEKFGRKVVYVAHSMGNPTLANFFARMDKKWKDKHIKIWTAISPVFMGSPKSLKSLISGENDNIPRILVGNIQMRSLLRTFPRYLIFLKLQFKKVFFYQKRFQEKNQPLQ
jgi:alpha-beta hydrolase superfamily lysophospholipase